ncbi:transducin family protein/WD-40 repeat family protein [Abeliophyllum distichum]|uniref:Transducin family protein/WD-40 repeat family protein n=1 Tax=Abeliophyllum distichum TaxID=126358 RepID=A0ABD1PPM3_9LAMI
MGGVEHEDPPSKRVKVSSEESESFSNGSSLIELARIIAEALYSLGYEKTGAHLEEESGIPLHSTVVNLFMQQIIDGKWDESVATLHKVGLMDENIVKLASFVILEQKFFELLDGEKVMDALKTLRTEIAPLGVHTNRLHELSSLIVSPSQTALDGTSDQRLRISLVEQALDLQRDACRFHNSLVEEMSLLTDHLCGRDHIPSQTLQILQEHSNEVWFLQFSHNGEYLASSSSDCLVIIWEVKVDGQISLKHRLSGHQKPVSYISWSPDDHQLLTCGVEEAVRRWDTASGECLHVYEKSGLGLINCAWAPDGRRIFCGVTDKSICMWDLEGKEVECWKGQKSIRISDLGISSDGKQLITTTGFCLLAYQTKNFHLWSIDGSVILVAKYRGHKRSRLVVRSCFGGLEQAFIASGSEDSQVYIWHRVSGELILTLPGHSGAVNCVSWNPANPHMLASASDDRTIRIWGINQVNMTQNGRHSNGVCYCNGAT